MLVAGTGGGSGGCVEPGQWPGPPVRMCSRKGALGCGSVDSAKDTPSHRSQQGWAMVAHGAAGCTNQVSKQ